MDILELEQELNKLSIPRSSYSLGRARNDSLCLENNLDNWEIYYSERGGKSGISKFDNEATVCAVMLKELKRGRT